ncbi:MAG: RidA family protein [Hyphomicrobiales bacterium]|nr:RidA family protein [Hyphomicrobiales bacterium]
MRAEIGEQRIALGGPQTMTNQRGTVLSTIDDRIAKYGIELPDPQPPMAALLRPTRILGKRLLVSAQMPKRDNRIVYTGRVGDLLDLETGQKATRLCALNVLAHAKAALDGDLDRIAAIAFLRGYVNVTPGLRSDCRSGERRLAGDAGCLRPRHRRPLPDGDRRGQHALQCGRRSRSGVRTALSSVPVSTSVNPVRPHALVVWPSSLRGHRAFHHERTRTTDRVAPCRRSSSPRNICDAGSERNRTCPCSSRRP